MHSLMIESLTKSIQKNWKKEITIIYFNKDQKKEYIKTFEKLLTKDPTWALKDVCASILMDTDKRSSYLNLGELGNEIQKRLADEGYNAIPDMSEVGLKDYDASHRYYIFNASSSLSKTKEPSTKKKKFSIKYLD